MLEVGYVAVLCLAWVPTWPRVTTGCSSWDNSVVVEGPGVRCLSVGQFKAETHGKLPAVCAA